MIVNANRDPRERREGTLEQTALRRIATLVAQGVQPHELFAVVAEEVGHVVDAPSVSVARYEDDGTVTVCSTFPPDSPRFPIGARVSLVGNIVPSRVRERAQPARLDDYTELEGEIGEAARSSGMRSSVGAPILVAGGVWGVIVASSTERLPEATEARLSEFTELLAAAIANTEAREALARLAYEQAALRRIATLVAEGVAAPELMTAVAEEVASVIGVEMVSIDRYDPDGHSTVLASLNDPYFAIGSRWALDGPSLAATVFETGRPARVQDYSALESPTAAAIRMAAVTSTVGAPIVVGGEVWGVICVGTREASPLPLDTEERLEAFTALVATAIANAASRETLARLADEQAALRRIATLVAEGVAAPELMTAVAEEVASVVGLVMVTIDRYDPDGHSTVLASLNDPHFPVGSRWPLDGPSLGATVLETGRPARVQDYSTLESASAAAVRKAAVTSTVGVPIVVDGVAWGVICVGTQEGSPLPPDTEERLEAFTDLVGTAIANAESRTNAERLTSQETALRRVATLVAEGVAPADLFAAVAVEVGQLFDFAAVTLNRYEEDAVVVVADPLDSGFPVGSRWPFDGDSLAVRVHATRQMARIDDYSDIESSAGARMRERASRSAIGVPIVVEGDLWGLLCVGAAATELLPPDTADRIAGFVELVGTAIANGQARDRLRLLAEEQASLRRVATLVAEGAPPDALFRAVADEVASVVGLATVTLSHHHADGTFTVVAATNNPGFPVGSRWPLEGPSLAATIHETGRTARIDDYSKLGGAVAAAMHGSSMRAAAGSPIVVDGKVWGHISVAAKGAEPLPAGTEQRLLDFTELISTAISNAESHDAIAQLANEQAALRRVATLVARDAPSTEVFSAVATEVGTLLDTDITVVGRYDGDGAATAIGSWSASPGGVPVGTRSVLGGHNVLTLVAETERPARVDGYDDASGDAAEIARRHGWYSSIAAPISVEGRLWGVMLVATQGPEPFPAGAEERLAAFTDLVATALANAQAHDKVRRFGEEQAALGRVATLVAAGAAPEQVFTAVVEEVSSLVGLERIELVRYDGDDKGTVIAASGDHPFPAGTTWSLDDPSVMGTVARTRRPARVDDYSDLGGEIARVARDAGFRSAIGAPITVEGRLWGVIIAISTDPEPIPERSEARLGQFTDLVATAVANAESRDALAWLADEQAALRRVATLVAQGVQPDAIFAAVGEEIGRLFGSSMTTVGRFEPDAQALVALGVGAGNEGVSIGSRWEIDDLLASGQVFRTGRSVRVDEVDWAEVRGELAPVGRRLNVASTVASPIFVEGRLWGVVSVSDQKPLPQEAEERLEKFSELIATAIANAESTAELAASRRRIVAAADEARRRIERDLHDGIQQRLIGLSFRARALARRPAAELPGIAAELSEGLKDVSDELREISRGIHPTILTEAGLGPALRALARRSSVPVDVDVSLDERLPAPVETAAYYIASEALTNVAKHAHANVVRLIAAHDNGILILEVSDDGIGGVEPGRGSGILGLTDRVEALGGTISIASPPRGGTTLSFHVPLTT